MNSKLLPIFAILCAMLSGCASIVDGGDKTLQVTSNPSGAQFGIYNKSGKFIISQTTPAIVTLKRDDGWFIPQSYRLVCDMKGYHSSEANVKSVVSPWYFGNIIFGGLIGIVIVDPATGAMWVFNKNEVHFEMDPIGILPEHRAAAEAYAEQLKSSIQPAKKAEQQQTPSH